MNIRTKNTALVAGFIIPVKTTNNTNVLFVRRSNNSKREQSRYVGMAKWQPRKLEGLVPKGLRVQVPLPIPDGAERSYE